MKTNPRRRGPSGEARARLLSILRAAGGPLDLSSLATEAGLHRSTTREHLARLAADGLVTRAPSSSARRGRPGLRYAADPEATAAAHDPRPFATLAGVLAEQLMAAPESARAATEAGERWGRSLAADLPERAEPAEATAVLLDILDSAGFAPDPPASPLDPIPLRRCPFGRLAVGREPVICGVHLGLMRGALAALDAPLTATRLEPFVEPNLCLAHLGHRAGA